MPEDYPISCLEVWGGNDPVDAAVALPGLDAWVFARPYENAAAGGDVHFVSSCSSGRITRLMVADVAGHGERVAETGVQLRSLMRQFMNRIDQRGLLRQMNERFGALAQAGRFATAIVTTFFAPTGRLSLCNAGHPHPLLFRAATGTWSYLDQPIESIEPSNTPLGVLENASYEQFDTHLLPGDMILCYTDSLPEARTPDGELLGLAPLLDAVNTLRDQTPATLIPRLLEALAGRGATLNDDLTLLLFRANGKARQAPFRQRLIGAAKLLASLFDFRRPVPWPEATVRNLGGAIAPPLSRR